MAIPKSRNIISTGPVTFRGTIKLHGTNSGVICTPEALLAQSRNRLLTKEHDNYDFAAYVEREDVSRAIRELEQEARDTSGLGPSTPLVFYGEWIGPRILKGVATARLPERQWVLFGVATRDQVELPPAEERDGSEEKTYLDALPTLGERFADVGIYSVLDIPTWELRVDFSDKGAMTEALERVAGWVDGVEKQCPWGRRFELEGTGEGIVWTPTGEHFGKSWLYWKAKGEAHTKVKTRRPSLDPEVVASVEAFVELTVTEPRLEQGLEYLSEMELPLDMRSTGHFLKWVGQDVKRECRAELEASDLEWRHVGKAVNSKSLTFFKAKVQSL